MANGAISQLYRGVIFMTEFMDYISTWSVLKWVVLVLAAGFIGHFGRMTAEAIIARMRKRRERESHQEEDTVMTSQSDDGSVEFIPDEGAATKPSSAGLNRLAAADPQPPDKKTLKAIAKARKKEAKSRLKQNK